MGKNFYKSKEEIELTRLAIADSPKLQRAYKELKKTKGLKREAKKAEAQGRIQDAVDLLLMIVDKCEEEVRLLRS